ncbi:hypothetical protein CMT90_11790 [Elizabethkingia anophelis]|uniref:ParB/RepB/Spo0J family partition protein n=1 Tax=Elizabethkingia anophelis TaxID=1117645 RepID=UPI001A2317C6|nr:hypothetical protein [Elizabethkingia anophelis]HAT3994327.1 ParB/RepB/Spo0J family partition protein [Elizabethkingia anophelis]HAT3997994.1 ParB/RepB/Spo0J family partition protein [Elizabethkingia anophelis]HAT4005569.1 ParB/RepB/Spo0J family partition protein [Elizabethkingia anophelis]
MSEESKKKLIEGFKPYSFVFLELPVEVVELDPNQPRKAFGHSAYVGDYGRLLNSIAHYGIEDPIKVCEMTEGRYIIMDGHRRFTCAKELKFKTVPCRIYPKMSEGEFEARRYEMQNNRRNWKPIERANAIHKVRMEYLNASKKEIADLLGITQTSLTHFTELRNLRMEYLELMSEYNLKEHQRVGFMRLLPKLRKIKDYEIDDIVRILFEKIHGSLLYRICDFNSLSKIFMNASINEEELLFFLQEPKISVDDLLEMTQLSGISTQLKNLIRELSMKASLDIKLTEKEKELANDLSLLMNSIS